MNKCAVFRALLFCAFARHFTQRLSQVFVLLFALMLCLGATKTVRSATFLVTKTTDTNDGVCNADCSLREAVAAANAAPTDDFVEFDPAIFGVVQTINLTLGEFLTDNAGQITINGPGASLLTVSGNNTSRVYTNNGAIAIVRNMTFANGNAQGNNPGKGGAIFAEFNGTLTLEGITIRNSVANQAGGIYNANSTLTLRGCTVNNNQSSFGGVIDSRSPLTIESSVIHSNGAANQSSAIVISASTATILNSTIRDNTGTGISNYGTLNLERSTVSGNSSEFAAGGIFTGSNQTVANISNSTISGNSTQGFGGGIYTPGNSTINLIHSTIANNISDSDSNGAGHGGGINNSFGGTVNAKNSIIAGNVDNTGTAPDFGGTLVSQGYNLIGNSLGLSITGNTVGNIVGQNALLLPLGDYGGSTKTHAFQPGSPAIDAANLNDFLQVDQRGVSRPRDGDRDGSLLPDVGSFESNPATFTVTKTADTNDGTCNSDCSLREAILASSSLTGESIIDFLPAVFGSPQTITLPLGEIVINSDGIISVDGPGANLLTISGGGNSRIFYVASTTVTLKKLKISGGNGQGLNSGSGGGIYNQSGTLTVADALLHENSASFAGGGIYNEGGTVNVLNSTLNANAAANAGGGIRNAVGSMTHVSNSTFTDNTAPLGGAIQNFGGVLSIGTSTFRSNSANSGGGIQNLDNGMLTVNNSTFESNTASVEGGAIHSSGDLLLLTSRIIRNSVVGNGRGGGLAASVMAEIDRVTFTGNTASVGGGIHTTAEMTIDLTAIAGNSAGNRGGGIDNGGLLTVRQSSFNDNSAALVGGAVNNNGPMVLSNSTVSRNASVSMGGGVFNEYGGGFSYLISSTIVNNRAGSGGGVRNVAQNLAVRNTIIANNFALQSGFVDFEGVMTSQGFNLIKTTAGTTIVGNTAGNIFGLDPRLGPLRNNGGLTVSHGLRAGSPAIDAASTGQVELQDQRQFSRPVDGNGDGFSRADIGSIERYNSDRVGSVLFDYDGDGKADLSVSRPSSGVWYVRNSSSGSDFAVQFGFGSDAIVPADYDGDGKTDVAVYRPENGLWYWFRSSDGTIGTNQFGTTGDRPVPQDYDGDGRVDVAIYRPGTGTWWVYRSSDNQVTATPFGISEDQPTLGDFDGDGKGDLAVFRPSTGVWYRTNSGNGSFFAVQFGVTGDQPVPADFDGDGKTDIAVYRPADGGWFKYLSSNGAVTGEAFGTAGDKPVAADYDGDGRTDVAVFRPSNGTWYANRTTAGILIQQFGTLEDRPTPNAFVP